MKEDGFLDNSSRSLKNGTIRRSASTHDHLCYFWAIDHKGSVNVAVRTCDKGQGGDGKIDCDVLLRTASQLWKEYWEPLFYK